MRKVLFVLGGFCRHDSPNGICVEKIKDCFDEETHVDIVSWESEELPHDENVYPVYFRKYRSKIIKKISKILFYPVGFKIAVKRMQRAINDLFNQEKYDAIIGVMNPPEAIEACYRLKKKFGDSFNLIIYEIDPQSNRYGNEKGFLVNVAKKRANKWEKKVYSYADHIIHMITHKDHYDKLFSNRYASKTSYLDIPGFTLSNYSEASPENYDFIYTGAFYPVLREPDVMLRCIGAALKIIGHGTFDIYTNNMIGHIESIVSKENFNGIHVRKVVSKEKIEEIIKTKSYLVSVGNASSNFLPSKIIEYISTNKPIIHFCYGEEDVSLSYLKKYGNCLVLNADDPNDENVERVLSFIKKEKNGKSANELRELFTENTPEYTVKELIKIIDL